MKNGTATIFNATIAGSAIAAAFELGLLDELDEQDVVCLEEFCGSRDLHLPSVRAVLEALQCFDIVELEPVGDGHVARSAGLFADAYAEKGYFSWLWGGYGSMLRDLADVSRNAKRNGDFLERDGRRIAWAGRDYGARFVDHHFARALNGVPFTSAADIGCGSAGRLIALAQERPEFRGVGVEVDDGAVRLANRAIARAGLDGRITVLHGDLRELAPAPECAGVDLVFSFFMGHDLWPRDACLETLNRVRDVFPDAGRFLLCDTYRSDSLASGDVPVFTLGFELTHAVMDQYLPSLEEWLDLFEDSAWDCVERYDIEIPYSCIFDLRARKKPHAHAH